MAVSGYSPFMGYHVMQLASFDRGSLIRFMARSFLQILKERAIRSNHGRLTATLFEGTTERESALTI